MHQPRALIIREVQLAFMLNFTEMEPFRRALRSGDVPAPSGYIRGKPFWNVSDVERHYGSSFFDNPVGSEGSVLQAIEGL